MNDVPPVEIERMAERAGADGVIVFTFRGGDDPAVKAEAWGKTAKWEHWMEYWAIRVRDNIAARATGG